MIGDMVKCDVSDVTVHDGIVEPKCSDVIWMHPKFLRSELDIRKIRWVGSDP